MSQESYDAGYEDGRKSRDAEVASLELQYQFARTDLARALEEVERYKKLFYREPLVCDDVPF